MNGTRRRWVLLHGFTGAPASWDEVRAALAAQGEVLCPALVGHGSDAVAVDFASEVDRLAQAVRAAGFTGAHLGGYSLGARLALGLLVRHPALFARATLIGAHPGLAPEDPGRGERAAADERLAQLAERSLDRFLAHWRAQPLFATQRELSPRRRALQERVRAAHDGVALAAALRALSLARMPDWSAGLPRIAVALRLIAGGRDPKFVALARRMLPALRDATLAVVPGAGHNVVLERPEVVSAALLD